MAYSQRIAAAILVAVLGPATRAAAVPSPGPVNLLVNPGFETGDFFGWTVGGTSPQFGVATDGTPIPIPSTDQVLNPAFQNVRSGSFAANALIKDHVGDFWRIEFSQTVAVLPNLDYVVGFWVGEDSAAGGYGQFLDDQHTQVFIDGIGVLPNKFSPILAGDGPEDFFPYCNVFNSGSRTSIDVTFAINGVRAAASFDDFFLAEPGMDCLECNRLVVPSPEPPPPGQLPEPGTLLLLSSGLVGLCRRLHRAS